MRVLSSREKKPKNGTKEGRKRILKGTVMHKKMGDEGPKTNCLVLSFSTQANTRSEEVPVVITSSTKNYELKFINLKKINYKPY